MNSANGTPSRNTKVMNRFDLTSRLIAKLKHEEAVIGGIGNTNFDLWAAGHRPQNFYMLGSMGLAFPIALGHRPDADRRAHRRQAGHRHHPPRSRANTGTLHARYGRTGAALKRISHRHRHFARTGVSDP